MGQNWSLSLPMEPSFALFGTAIGTCAIAWGEAGILAVRLPASDDETQRGGILHRFPKAAERPPTKAVEKVILDIRALLDGEFRDLRDAPLDMSDVPEFYRRVYEVARQIDPGQTMTYGQISNRLKAPGTSRAVGQAMGANPFPIIVPCHRVLASSGKSGGFSAPGGVDTKLKILNIERVHGEADDGLFGSLPLAVAPRRLRPIPRSRRR
jgi:methylated-DNA-[protein]-cysteine S-methyltransferase